MVHRLVRSSAVLALVIAVVTTAGGAAAAPTVPLVALHVGEVTHQDVAPQPGSEPDTVVEPDVAVSPLNRNVAIAAAHDGRYPDGGAVTISVAWTNDAGGTWHHTPVSGITAATGGPYERASDPVVTFGPDGTAYLSVLLIDLSDCPSAVAVLRSANGGQTWSAPTYVHQSSSCEVGDDKNWLVVDTSPSSPHFGRLYQFWSLILFSGPDFVGAPQVVRWSDDKGLTWSATSYVTPPNRDTVNSQPMILADGTVVDTYLDYEDIGVRPDLVSPGGGESPLLARRASTSARQNVTPAALTPGVGIFATKSTDGGLTWQPAVEVVGSAVDDLPDVRCCLFAADVDQVTHKMYVTWLDAGGAGDSDPVMISSSTNGTVWSSPVPVSQGDAPGVERVNVDVVALAGDVYVSYGTRTQASSNGGFVQQQVSVSHDGGLTFAAPQSFGQRSVLQYAAQSRGYFPGDYIGAAIAPGLLYLVWARSSQPPASSTSPFHQVIDGATLITNQAGVTVCVHPDLDLRAAAADGTCPSGYRSTAIATVSTGGTVVCVKADTDWRAPYADGSCPSGYATVRVATTATGGEAACLKVKTDVRAPDATGCPTGFSPVRFALAGTAPPVV